MLGLLYSCSGPAGRNSTGTMALMVAIPPGDGAMGVR